MKISKVYLITVFSILTSTANAALTPSQIDSAKTNGKVLLSVNKICHDQDSTWYKGLKRAKAQFDSLNTCISADGNRAPKRKTKEAIQETLLNLEDEIEKTVGEKAIAADKDKAVEQTEKLEELKKERDALNAARDDLNEFTGLRFGYGLAFTYTSKQYVDDVDILNQKIFVKKSRSHRGVFMLETHKFFQPSWWTDLFDGQQAGIGPFAAVSLADSNGGDPFSAYGLGVMAGFKDKDSDGSWNVGIGLYINTEFKVLRGDLNDGDATTETNPENLIVESDEEGLMIIVSSSW